MDPLIRNIKLSDLLQLLHRATGENLVNAYFVSAHECKEERPVKEREQL